MLLMDIALKQTALPPDAEQHVRHFFEGMSTFMINRSIRSAAVVASLTGKVAIVTGASRGIGRAIAAASGEGGRAYDLCARDDGGSRGKL